MPYCDGELLHDVMLHCEYLQMMTCDYHNITTLALPRIKLYIKVHKQITGSLLNGSPDVELTYYYFMSGKYAEEVVLVNTNYFIKLQEVTPKWIQYSQGFDPSKFLTTVRSNVVSMDVSFLLHPSGTYLAM